MPWDKLKESWFPHVDERWNLKEDKIIEDLQSGKISIVANEWPRDVDEEWDWKWISIVVWPRRWEPDEWEKPDKFEEDSLGLTDLK